MRFYSAFTVATLIRKNKPVFKVKHLHTKGCYLIGGDIMIETENDVCKM